MNRILYLSVLVICACTIVPKEEIRLGAKWEQIDSSSFTPRSNFGVAIVDETIIVIGGFVDSTDRRELANDVWSSTDKGKTWKQIRPIEKDPLDSFTKRQKFGTTVIGKDIYIVGGGYADDGTFLNDVWKSSDFGATWTEITSNAEFSIRAGHKLVAIGQELYVIGGYNCNDVYNNEVWKSTNFGVTWSQQSDSPFKTRQGFTAINYKGEILLMGGNNPNSLTDLWRKGDGGWYTTLNVPFELFEQEVVDVKGDLFVIERNNVWKSIDEGYSWEKVLFEIPFSERTGYGLVNIGNQLIIFGGMTTTGKYLTDVWISEYTEL